METSLPTPTTARFHVYIPEGNYQKTPQVFVMCISSPKTQWHEKQRCLRTDRLAEDAATKRALREARSCSHLVEPCVAQISSAFREFRFQLLSKSGIWHVNFFPKAVLLSDDLMNDDEQNGKKSWAWIAVRIMCLYTFVHLVFSSIVRWQHADWGNRLI